jgi:asparagine synthase (glutamine-hydrolysing)
MCGITGVLELADPQRPVAPEVLRAMNACMVHRGPDSCGEHLEPGLGMAMRRLAIIDVTGGDQPIANEDGSIRIVYNGEIYNFAELRDELVAAGHSFATRADTEVIVHGYEEWGDDVLSRLRGMFAFSLWDAKRRRLLLARDRAGIKPLFYAHGKGRLLWGSELKCLLRHPSIERRLRPAGLHHFLAWSYVPAPLTLFEGIHELPAGHRLVAEAGGVRVERWWDLRYAVEAGRSLEIAASETRERLDEAVKLRMIAEVPLGAFLSGGIDSATVVALMTRHSSAPPKTFSIGYEKGGEFFDERPQARRVARLYGTEHHEFVLDPDLVEVLPRLVRAFDQPFGNASAIPNWYLAQLTRRHVTVALSGLGGDEVYAGYERYRGALLAERLGFLPKPLVRHLLLPLAEALPDSRRGDHWRDRARRFVRTLELDFDARYRELVTALHRERRRELLTSDLDAAVDADEPDRLYQETTAPASSAHPLHRALYADLMLYLPGDLLTLTDRMSMAHSLEVRVPFLDHRVLEHAATLPPEYKLAGLDKKRVLKRAVADLLPKDLLERRKMGFSVPLTLWFREQLRPYVESVLSESAVRSAGVFRYPAVRRMLDDHYARRANFDNQIFSLLTFTLWHQEFVDQSGGSSTGEAGGPSSRQPIRAVEMTRLSR